MIQISVLFFLYFRYHRLYECIQDKTTAKHALRAIILGANRPDVIAEAERLAPEISRYVQIVQTDFTGHEDMHLMDADLAIVLGGDGSILRAARQMGHRQLPVLAVNMGKLGFLANISVAELPAVLPDYLGCSNVAEHLMFECSLIRQRHNPIATARSKRSCRAGRHSVFAALTSIFTLTRNWQLLIVAMD